MCLNFSLSSKLTEIRLNIISDCADSAELGWTVFTTDDSLASLFNCSLVANKKPPLKPKLYQQFLTLPMHGLYTLEDKLLGGEQYWFKIKCGDIVSNIVLLTALDNCTQAVNRSSHDSDVIYQKQSGLFASTQDTVLGVVIGLFGIAIILVTSYYLWKRYRNRQRRLRIRSYLGASLIDPFTGMQNRMDEIEANGGQRLMTSRDSL